MLSKTMSPVLLGIATVTLGVFLSGCGSDNSSQQKAAAQQADKVYIVKFSHVVSAGTPKGKAADFFAKKAEELSNGQIKVEVFPSAQLVDDDKVFQELKRNNVQMAVPSFSKFTPLVTEFNLWDIPFLFKDNKHLYRVMDGEVGQILRDKITAKGFVALDYWDAGFKQFSSNKKPIVVPADAQGQKMRIMTSKVIEEQTRAIGANPQVMNFAEVYSALQTGVIDSAENPLSNFYNSKFYEVQSSLSMTNHGYLGYLVVVSEKFWQNLPDNLKEIFKQALDEATAFERQEAAKDDGILLANLKDYAEKTKKLTVYELNEDQKKLWQETMQAIYPKFYDLVDKNLIQKVLDAKDAE